MRFGGDEEPEADLVAEQLNEYVDEVEEYLVQTGSLDVAVTAEEEEA